MVRPLFRFRALPAGAAPAAAPDIGAIEASLRNCSLARRHGRGYGHHPRPVAGVRAGDAGPGDDITVELNSEVPLPGNWEQILNIQTGEIHYINRVDGTKTNRDPRLQLCCSAASHSSPESLVYDADVNDSSSDDTSYTPSSSDSSSRRHSDGTETSSSSSTLSTATTAGSTVSFSAESSAADSSEATAGAVLVLVGCRLCLTLSMVPRRGEECPKCGGSLLLRF